VTIAEASHGRGRYQRGCRCATCKEANRSYQRSHRSKRTLRAVTTPPADETSGVTGPVETAVESQLAGLPSAQERPGLAAIAIALARVLDDPSAVPHFAAAAHRLTEVLTTLTKSSTRRTRLSAVRNMTQRGTDATLP